MQLDKITQNIEDMSNVLTNWMLRTFLECCTKQSKKRSVKMTDDASNVSEDVNQLELLIQ